MKTTGIRSFILYILTAAFVFCLGFFLFDPRDGELSFGSTFLIGKPMNTSVFTTMFVYLVQRAEIVHDVLHALCEEGFSDDDIDAFLEAAQRYEEEEASWQKSC